MRGRALCIVLAIVLLLPAALAAERTEYLFAMDTVMALRVDGADDALMDRCTERILQLEHCFDAVNPEGEIARLNAEGAADLSEDTCRLLEAALDLCADTDGALDITIAPVVKAWGFTDEQQRIPEPETLADCLSRVDYRRVELQAGRAALPEGTELDLGGVAKGYASDEVIALLRDSGITSALISLGGNVYCLGRKPDGSNWRVGIQDPEGEGSLGVVQAHDCAVVTSGQYERWFEGADGKRYGHIIDPSTGLPVENGMRSVTVIAEDGTLCDALSTALFVMGEARAAAYLERRTDVEAVLVGREILATAGLKGRFTLYGNWESQEIRWIREAA